MAMVALAESLPPPPPPPPPPPRPREEVEERRFACGGGDADGQGSDMQETSEPIGPIQGRGNPCSRFSDSGGWLWRRPRREGNEAAGAAGRRRSSGRGSNGRKKDTKNL